MNSMYRMKSNAQAVRSKTPRNARKAAASNGHAYLDADDKGPRIQVRRSGVHGKGVFARRPIEPGEVVVEYKGEMISWAEALRRHPHDPKDPNHTFFFHIDDERVIDGKVNGNAAKWINHACDPNCEADEVGDRVFIKAIRPIAPGEELFYDYGLIIDERYTPKLKKQFACHCGSPKCRGTMLAPKR
jgi:SET domain-containing protein